MRFPSLTLLILITTAHSASFAQNNPVAPANQHAPNTPAQPAFPAWLKPGVRVSYESGDSIIPNTPNALQPDGKGNWFDTQGRAFQPGRGGVGITALDIVDVTANTLAADVRNYARTLLDADQITFVSSAGVIGSRNGLGDFWIPPDRLRAMEPGNDGGVLITRETYPLNGKNVEAVGITTYDQKGYSRFVYDIESGIMIVLSTSRVEGNSNVISHAKLLDIRQRNLPWMNDVLPDWMGPNHQLDYAGVYNNIANGMESPMRYSFSLALGERHGNAVRASQTSAVDQGNGMPVIPTHADRVFASGGLGPLYISPQTLARLQPGAVIDEDAPTKTRVSFLGVQNNLAFITDQRAIETYQFGYDTQTGVLKVIFLEKQQGLGAVLRVQLQLANIR